ncbi:MAG: alcohol dehydrogenase catalytic domain-containing protein [Candidatus Omnitrophica bacterium]|nr:alcohol dehydrogenase catalytic domain-containing protein [Candidatus Omnitrophota bacterium]
MKAIRIHGPKDARYEEVPMPKPGPDDVLVRIRATGICATDIELYDGTMFYITNGMTRRPFIPGHEWSGDVIELGANALEFSLGDRVVGECSIGCRQCAYCRRGWYHLCPDRGETGFLKQAGAFAEYVAFPRFFLHKCDGLAYDSAAFIEPTGVALNPTRQTRVSPEDYVAVMGPGPIGLFAVQTAKAYGARKVILAGRSDGRLAVGKQLGADATINVKTENLVEKVREATAGHMIDVVIEAAGKKEVWPDIVSILAPRARIGMTGLFAGAKCEVDFDPLVVNEVQLFGCLGGPSLWPEAISLHQSGKVTAAPLITHRLPLADFAKGIEISRNRVQNAIKVVLQP